MRVKRILGSLMLVAVVAAAVGLGTRAFFSDTETSKDNVLQAGSIDLLIDNESWYYGPRGLEKLPFPYTWDPSNLTIEKFFDFNDLKPGDWGEDTISVEVNDNPAYACANITLTQSHENERVDPEKEAGDDSFGKWGGELDEHINFVFWADDGDNVWECWDEVDGRPTDVARQFEPGVVCENILLEGTADDLPQGDGNTGQTFTLADSAEFNLRRPMTTFLLGGGTNDTGDYLEPGLTYYIGKFWCFGDLGEDPVDQDFGEDPDRSPETVGPGFTCDGTGNHNVAQTDRVKGDISFYAIQRRHNDQFLCSSWNPNPQVEATVDVTDNWSQVDFDGKEWFAKARGNNTANFEYQLGIDDTDGSTFDSDNTTWTNGTKEHFKLELSGTTGTLTITGKDPVTWTIPAGTYGRIGITLKAHGTGTTDVENLTLDLASLPTDSLSVSAGTGSLTISGVDLSGGFVLEGDFTFSWTSPAPDTQSGAESQKVQFSID